MLELNKLYNMDCMQGMKEFPDGFFDLAIVDPTYGIGIDGQKKRVCGNPKHNRKEHIRKSWDKAIPPPEYFRELERVSKAQVIWGGNYFVPYLEQGHKGWLVWDKGQHGLTMSDCELAYTSFDTPTRVFVCNRVELLNDGTIHPTQKPVKLYSWVLSLFARKGMKILDTHAGSGSSLIACYRQGGLDFVGFEIDEDYCRAANERLEQEQAQIRLFDLLEQEERKAQATLLRNEGRKHNAGKKDAISCRKDHGRSVLFHEVLQRAKEAGGRRLHRRKSGASSGGGLHVGSLYAYVRRYACRVRRSLFSSGLEREQRREI